MNTTLPDPDGDLDENEGLDANLDSDHDGRGSDSNDDSRLAAVWTSSRESLQDLFRRPEDGVVTGLSADLAEALGIDALWIRLGFVLFALVGGIGIVAYLGLWLVLVVGDERRWARPLGAAAMLVALPLLVSGGGDNRLVDGQLAIIVLLIGLTFALWRPSNDRDGTVRPRRWSEPPVDAPVTQPAPPVESELAAPVANPEQASEPSESEPRVRRRERRLRTSPFGRTRTPPFGRRRTPPSPLGRATFGAAIVTAAVGGLIDQLNGGRLHPEQWLGAAAIVCGFGLLIGMLRGHARWLIIPAALFAVAGYGTGLVARAGVPLDRLTRSGYVYVSEEQFEYSDLSDSAGFEPATRVGFGDTSMTFDSPREQQVVVDSRTAVGTVSVNTADDVAVEFRTDLDSGVARVDGVEQNGTLFRTGPDRDPDIVVDVGIVRGDVEVFTFDREERELEAEMIPNPDEFVDTDGRAFEQTTAWSVGAVSMTPDGVVVIADGQGLIGADNEPLDGDFTIPLDAGSELDGQLELITADGSWRLVGKILITPYGDVIDLDQARRELGVTDSEAEPLPTIFPSLPTTTSPVANTAPSGTVTPENAVPENASPENPSPENPSPENPSPENPSPENPSPENNSAEEG